MVSAGYSLDFEKAVEFRMKLVLIEKPSVGSAVPGGLIITKWIPMQTDEKFDFSKRLRLALKRSHRPIDSATELALQFNLRHPNDSISVQAAHKWLMGKARPTADKIETLANWLNVSAHWLRYGSPNDVKPMQPPGARRTKQHAEKDSSLSDEEFKLVVQFRRLSTHQRHLIAELTEQLAIEQEIWPE